MDDNGIIDLYVLRNERAVEETHRMYGGKLFGLAMRILENYEDSEECRNDTYLKAWDTIPPTIPNFLYGYLAQICRSRALNMIDYRNAKKRNMQIVELTKEMEECIPNPDNVSLYSEDELGDIFSRFLRLQTQDARVIFIRRYWHGETSKSIAQRYGMRDAAVRKSLERTRRKLKKYLKQEGICI